MNEQLLLLKPSLPTGDGAVTDEAAWRLDDHTREVGRRGLEEARAALRRSAAEERGRSARRTAA